MNKLPLRKTLIASAILLTTLGMGTFAVNNVAIASPSSNTVVSSLVSHGEPSLAPIIKQVLPSVVAIRVKAVETVNSQAGGGFDDFFGQILPKEFGQFFGNGLIPSQPTKRSIVASGSGVIIDADNGYVLTNYHVIKGAKTIAVTLYDNRTYKGTIVGSDPDTDLAVIKLSNFKNLHAIEWGDSDQEQVGDFVVALGNPFGIGLTATAGIVSALNRSTQLSLYSNYIQTDAAINHGNSGGALVNLNGQLIGINSAIISDSGGSDGVGFAIPSNIAKRISQQIIEHGHVLRGQIGIRGANLSPQLQQALKISVSEGAFVSEVLPNTPASRAGLKAGDVIVKLNNTNIVDFNQLRAIIGSTQANTKFEVTYIRDGKTYTTEITSSARSATTNSKSQQATPTPTQTVSAFGATFAVEGKNLVVQSVINSSILAQYGIQKGDKLITLQGKPVNSIEDLQNLIKTAQNSNVIILKFLRGNNNSIFITISNGY